ncbi:PorV/PorQ family protein [Bacteroides pyogenes]|uniref:PorV/PorQ family protein n=1 Tax=Bacteroides pyogenes TaxID=310300 RepID=UPI0011E477C7|nr:PorV/PorQ family protein [Bacteroides pyogenes]MBR8709807.1 hypothetical protein [Bacteroides pyogenes]MBR8718702.1 hypothetical protein [Bacteroides pyogenes]MBR8748169.1 hypothetical protein [Bacteroides pyogenes]MBR8758450.1 hypothetical protein [Bacteroides pyogenes]MBR8781678.1 hypothetical protein [Bacteroides pyogenes]
MKRLKLFLFVACLAPVLPKAQGITGIYFPEIIPDAQSTSMGGAGLAVTNNPSIAIYHNASTIAFSQEVMGFTYSYADIKNDHPLHSASLFYRMGRQGKQGFTAAFRHVRAPEIVYEGSDKPLRPMAWSLGAGYFNRITESLSLSLTLQYLRAKTILNESKGTAYVDLGATYHQYLPILNQMATWSIGIQAANLGGKLDGVRLPSRLGIGSAIILPFNIQHSLQIACDIKYFFPSDYRSFETAVGAEYSFLKYGIVRAGYNFGDKDKWVGNYATLGGGIHYWPVCIDFSYALAANNSFMNRTWQLSLGIVF